MSHGVPCSTALFRWYTGTTERKMHFESSYAKISANSGVDQGCSLSTCGFSADIDAKLFANLDDWYLWIKPQCLADAATRSELWRASCPDPVPQELLDKVKPTLSCLGGHLQMQGVSPVPLSLEATMENCLHTRWTQRRKSQRADCQRPHLHVCWRSQRTRAANELCSGTRTKTFDIEVTAFWSQLIKRDATSSSVLLTSQATTTRCWFSCAAPCGGSMASLAIG